MDKKYILFSLDEDKTGKLATVLGNKTCKRVLNLLAEEELSETDISKQLKIPLNTVGYSIKKLKSIGLIEEKTHYFSLRGKRTSVYRVSNKEILISPKKASGNSLKTSLSLVLVGVSAFFTGFILWSKQTLNSGINALPKAGDSSGETMMLRAVDEAQLMTASAATQTASLYSFGITEWFLLGIWALIILSLVISNLKPKSKTNLVERR